MRKFTDPEKQISKGLMIPIILMIGFVPLIVHTFVYRCHLSEFDWFPDAYEEQVDVFFAWKMIAIILIGAVMLGILLFRYFNRKEHFQFENAFYFLFFYMLFVAMSALFSPYKYWVSAGIYELFESVWTVFAYLILCFYTYQYVRNEGNLTVILRWSGIGMLIVTLIGAFQYFGLDLFQTTLGKHLITGPQFWDNLDSIDFTMGANRSYATLYNPNFLSFYFGMLLPVAVCLMIASRKIIHKVLMAVVAILAVICMIGSHSDSGWLALAIAVCIVVLILLSRTRKTLYFGIGAAVLGLAALVAILILTPIGTRLSATIVGTYRMEERFVLRSIAADNDCVSLNISGNKIKLRYVDGDTAGESLLSCTDENGTELSRSRVDVTNLIDQLDDSAYVGCQIQPILLEDMLGIRVTLDGKTWDFAYIPNDGYYYANSAGKLTRPSTIKSANLFLEDTMSGRGHMWNQTLPLLGKHIFIGVGANAYMLAYPQDDYIYHAYVSGANTYDVKAHCWYLQQWVENGMIGLLLLLSFLGCYIIRSVRIYRRADLKESLTWIGIGLFTAVLVYVIVAIANDSNVCTAPVFWGILGLAMAVNRMISEKYGLFSRPADETSAEPAERKSQEPPSEKTPSVKDTMPVSKPIARKKSGKKKARGKHR